MISGYVWTAEKVYLMIDCAVVIGLQVFENRQGIASLP